MEPATKKRKLSNGESNDAIEAPEIATDKDKRLSLFVRSLPASVTKDRLIEHFSQSYPLKHATVVLDPTTRISRGFGFVTFTDAEDAQQALAEFNDSVLDGRKIKVEAAEARHRDTKETVRGKLRSKNTTGEELRAKKQEQQQDDQPPKLIVRNLPWSVKTGEDLTKLFLSYGKVKHAVVPKLPEGKGQAGFGIVIIRGKKNAERALQGVNGKVVDGRTLAVDWAVDKETWQKVQSGQVKADGVQEDETLSTVAKTEALDATVAEPEDENDEDVMNGVAQKAPSDGDEDGLSEIDDEDVPPKDEDEDEDEDSECGVDLNASDISDLVEPPESTQQSTYNTENTTVFIRNLPYDTTDENLSSHFRDNFGPIRYARVVFDHETERPRGTAFVCFRNEEDAKSCVKDCPKPDSSSSALDNDAKFKTGKNAPQQNFASMLQNPSADPTGGKYTINSRLLHITRALPKPEANRRASESQSQRTARAQSDKRRLYLLSEGTVAPGSTLYNTLSKPDIDVRVASAKQRQKMVKTNPNLGLSLTRLSIRNLPRWVDSKALKGLAREAIVGFASDVKAGNRQPISKEELARDGEAGRLAEKQRKEAGKGVVRQAKVVFESELSGGKVGEGKGGRSRGYGFIEYWGHRSALMGLRWLNGHLVKRVKGEHGDGAGEVGEERGKRLIVEFAIENAQVVQRRDERERREKMKRGRAAEGGKGGEELDADGKKIFKGRDFKNIGRGRDFRKQMENSRGREFKNNNNDRSGDKRKRDGRDEMSRAPPSKKQSTGPGKQAENKDSRQDQDERNKVAARNRIIAQKRQKRKSRRS